MRCTPACCRQAQKATAPAVTQAGGDDVLALKGNQGALHEDVSLFLDDPDHARICDAFQGVDGAHGRIEIRRALICHDLDWLNACHDWPGLKAIGKVIATREKEGKATTQSRYYLLSTPLSAERFLAVTRAHWAIENSLHYHSPDSLLQWAESYFFQHSVSYEHATARFLLFSHPCCAFQAHLTGQAAINDRRNRTILANATRLITCALFFARPL